MFTSVFLRCLYESSSFVSSISFKMAKISFKLIFNNIWMVPNVYNNVKKNLFSSCNILGNSLKQGYLFTKKLKHNYSVFIKNKF